MDVHVLMASGEADEWENVADVLEEAGSLLVVSYIEGDEISGAIKTVTVSQEVDHGSDTAPFTKSTTFQVIAHYAPGMWIKVEYT